MTRILTIVLILLPMAMITAKEGQAGQKCLPRQVTPETMIREINVAVQLEQRLEKHYSNGHGRLAIVAREGADLSRHGLKYSHASFALRQDDGQWQVIQLLNKCGTGQAALYRDGLLNFVQDDLFSYDFAIAMPETSLGNRLIALLETGDARRYFRPDYNLIANPMGRSRYQNCNMWLLELVSVANQMSDHVYLVKGQDVRRYYKSHGFKPDYVRAGPLERLGARLTRPNIHFDDHSLNARLSGKYPVVSVRSLLRWLDRTDSLQFQQTLREQRV